MLPFPFRVDTNLMGWCPTVAAEVVRFHLRGLVRSPSPSVRHGSGAVTSKGPHCGGGSQGEFHVSRTSRRDDLWGPGEGYSLRALPGCSPANQTLPGPPREERRRRCVGMIRPRAESSELLQFFLQPSKRQPERRQTIKTRRNWRRHRPGQKSKRREAHEFESLSPST